MNNELKDDVFFCTNAFMYGFLCEKGIQIIKGTYLREENNQILIVVPLEDTKVKQTIVSIAKKRVHNSAKKALDYVWETYFTDDSQTPKPSDNAVD